MTEATGATLRARPTIYNGTPMRSRLEARVAAWLDSLGVRWEYEPVAYASSAGQYLPDFGIITDPPRWNPHQRIYLEVKGVLDASSYFKVMDRMLETVIPSEPRAILLMADAETLEAGQVYGYNYPRIGAWDSCYLVACLSDLRAIELPGQWRLPAWDAGQ